MEKTLMDAEREHAALMNNPMFQKYPFTHHEAFPKVWPNQVVDQLVYEAYCAGVNQLSTINPMETQDLNTTTGEFALKASLWCKKLGTR